MIVVRDIFRLRFGQSKEATGLWKQALASLKAAAPESTFRLLTDLAGVPYYTIILEGTHPSLASWEGMHKSAPAVAEWKTLYAKIIPLTEDGRREILSVVE
jgi:hypothetical protein